MESVFDAFADGVRLNILGPDGRVVTGGVVTIARDGHGKICALSFQDVNDKPHASAAATEAHLGIKPETADQADTSVNAAESLQPDAPETRDSGSEAVAEPVSAKPSRPEAAG